MRYKFGQTVSLVPEFYQDNQGYIINYDYDDNRIPEQKYRYLVRLYCYNHHVDKWFWENELDNEKIYIEAGTYL